VATTLGWPSIPQAMAPLGWLASPQEVTPLGIPN